MNYQPDHPIIIQGAKCFLQNVDILHYQAARDLPARFAELEKSPEYIHTYHITPLSLWNAASAGMDAEAILAGLARSSRFRRAMTFPSSSARRPC